MGIDRRELGSQAFVLGTDPLLELHSAMLGIIRGEELTNVLPEVEAGSRGRGLRRLVLRVRHTNLPWPTARAHAS